MNIKLPCRVEIVEPHTLIVHQPPGGYLLDNRQVQMTCAKSAWRLSGRRDKVQGGSLTCMALVTSGIRNGTSREALVVYSLYDFGS
jgi:hypothetical protein